MSEDIQTPDCYIIQKSTTALMAFECDVHEVLANRRRDFEAHQKSQKYPEAPERVDAEVAPRALPIDGELMEHRARVEVGKHFETFLSDFPAKFVAKWKWV